MRVGTEWIIDAEGCDADALRDAAKLQAVLRQVIDELQLHVATAPLWHQFPAPGGITGLVLLTESHLACHTYPEHNAATFNLYCCKTRPEWPWRLRLTEILGASHVRVRKVSRGAAESAAAAPAELFPARRRAQ